MINSTVLFPAPPPAQHSDRLRPNFSTSRSLMCRSLPLSLAHKAQKSFPTKQPRAVFPAGEIFKQEVASLEVVRLVCVKAARAKTPKSEKVCVSFIFVIPVLGLLWKNISVFIPIII